MGLQLDSLEQTRQQISRDIEAGLGVGAASRRSAAGVIGYALAGAVQGLHAHIRYRERNFLPDELADAEGVERWARIFKLWYLDPTQAEGVVQCAGAIGAELVAGTRMQSDQGVLYESLETLRLATDSAVVRIRALDAGSTGNLPGGARLTLLKPVSGINAAVIVDANGLTGGAAAESLDGLRARVQRRFQYPSQGGTLTDYETWALEAHPAVTRAWATEHEQGPGSVIVRIVCDNSDTPIPSAAVLEAVTEYIGVRRPAGRRSVYVLPPVASEVVYQIRLTPDTNLVRAAVEAELRDLHRRQAKPGAKLSISHIREAISTAPGEQDHDLLYPMEDLVFGTGVMPLFGGVTWR